MKIPTFSVATHKGHKLINSSEWEVRKRRMLCVKGTDITLCWGSTSEFDKLSTIAEIHNGNLLLGITDKEYNESLIIT